MKKFRWILLCAALLAAALFALWRLPALFAPSVPAALTYTPPDDETVSAVRAAVQDRFGSDGIVYLLPDCYAYLKGMFDISDFVNTVNHFLKYRVLYASSYPLRSVAQARALWMDLPFTDEALRLTLYENAARLLEI